jgi:hypothetical protein
MDLVNNIFEWLCVVTILIALFFSFRSKNKLNLKPISLYVAISLVFNIFLKTNEFFLSTQNQDKYISAAMNIYSWLEISILFYFLYCQIWSSKFRAIIITFFSVYLSLCTIIWTLSPAGIFRTIPDLFGIENLFITTACLFYLYEIIKSDLVLDFKYDPKFIITCGILFYFSISIPVFFNGYNLKQMGFLNTFYLLNNSFYMLLFISFIKAFLCPIQEQKQ